MVNVFYKVKDDDSTYKRKAERVATTIHIVDGEHVLYLEIVETSNGAVSAGTKVKWDSIASLEVEPA